VDNALGEEESSQNICVRALKKFEKSKPNGPNTCEGPQPERSKGDVRNGSETRRVTPIRQGLPLSKHHKRNTVTKKFTKRGTFLRPYPRPWQVPGGLARKRRGQ